MASFLQSLPVSPAVRRQSTAMPLRLNIASSMASSRTHSPMSTLCSASPLTPSPNPLQCSQRRNSAPALPYQQSRTFLVQLRRQAQAHLTKNTPAVRESVPSPAAANLQLTNLPYFIRRTPSNQYPVYLVTKAGGTKQETKIQKTEGDMDALRNDLAVYLGLESGDTRASKSPDISINRLNGHIVVKGWRKPEILKFLAERNF